MVILLPDEKLQKVQKVIRQTCNSRSLSRLDIQKVTGYLNPISTVIPLGRSFLRRVYNMQLDFPPREAQYYKRRISGEVHQDLAWWSEALWQPRERSIARRRRTVIRPWFNAASTQGLGGYSLSQSQVQSELHSAFSIVILLSIAKGRDHINTQDMRAVEQVPLHWASNWKGIALVRHVDN